MKPSSLTQRSISAMQFSGIDAGELRQHADGREVVRVELADAVDQVVPVLCPVDVGFLAAEVVGHGAGPRREDRHVRAALALEPDLGAF